METAGRGRRYDRAPEASSVKAKILIVGGGAMGTCIALEAAGRCDPLREPVVLLEKERLGAGSSGRSAAIVHQAYGERKLAGMARDALKTYAGIQTSSGRSVGYRKTGALILAGPEDGPLAARLAEEVAMQREIGIESHRVGAEEMRRLVPGIVVRDGDAGAWQPDGGFIDPARAIDVFAKLARSRGAITRIGIAEPRIVVEDGRIAGIESPAGSFEAPNVVLAAGPWSPAILAELGVVLPLSVVETDECFVRMPTSTHGDEDEDDHDGGQEFETRFLPDPLDAMPVAHPVVIDRERGFVARCDPAFARTRIERSGARAVERPSEGVPDLCDWVREVVGRRLPIYADAEQLGSQRSLATLTPDGLPIAGEVEGVRGLFVVAGLTGNDFQLAPSIGSGLAQMILGQPVSAFDPGFLSPARFDGAGARERT